MVIKLVCIIVGLMVEVHLGLGTTVFYEWTQISDHIVGSVVLFILHLVITHLCSVGEHLQMLMVGVILVAIQMETVIT